MKKNYYLRRKLNRLFDEKKISFIEYCNKWSDMEIEEVNKYLLSIQ
jgi:hypothetical protein